MDEKEKYWASIPEADTAIDAKEVEPGSAEILTWYARKDTLRRIGNTLYGNFIDTPGFGCTFQYMRSMSWLRVIQIIDLRPCDQGNGILVEITLSPRRPKNKT